MIIINFKQNIVINKLGHNNYKCLSDGQSRDMCTAECTQKLQYKNNFTMDPYYMVYKNNIKYNNDQTHFSKHFSFKFRDKCEVECSDKLECIQYYYTVHKSIMKNVSGVSYRLIIDFPTEPTLIYKNPHKVPG